MRKQTRNPLAANIATLLRQGAALERAGEIDKAQATYEQILALDKRNVQAMTLLGLMAVRAEKPFEAIPHFTKALKLNPKAADLHNNLAMLYIHLHRPDQAEPHALAAYKIDKKSTETLRILFKCYYQLGRIKESYAYIKKALKIDPDNSLFKLDLGLYYDTNGEPEKAKVIFQELLDSGYRTAHAYDGLVRVHKFTEEPAEYQQLKTILSDPKTPADQRHRLNRAAGKIADDLGRYDEAFEFFAASKSDSHATAKLNAFAERVATLKQVITPEFFAARRQYANPNGRPIFVFGMPRSGTTLVEQILASLPNVYGANELTYFLNQAARLGLDAPNRAEFEQALARLTGSEAKSIARDYLKLLIAYSADTDRVVDKMPYNFEMLWLLALLFPRASFIHCHRNPAATCLSIFMRPVKQGMPLDLQGQYYGLYHELMQHWHAVLPVNILDLSYEEHIADPEGQARRLVTHAGLEWSDDCLRFHEIKRDIRTPSRRQVEQPIYTSSLEGWRRYEKHLEPLIRSLGDLAPRKSAE